MNPKISENYDSFSGDYDRFVNWQNRLNFELPFLLGRLAALQPDPSGSLKVLDAACGTGMHAVALAQRGYTVTGSDLSAGMIEMARLNAQAAGAAVRFEIAGFGELAQRFGQASFDALLCLGNSLPHLLTPAERVSSLRDFAGCLGPRGMLVLQNRNFDAVMASRERAMDPVSHFDQDKEWLFLRFYEYRSDGLISFNIVTLQRQDRKPWSQTMTTTLLLPLLQEDLMHDLSGAGFEDIACYGSLDGSPFDPSSSGNLVVTARRV